MPTAERSGRGSRGRRRGGTPACPPPAPTTGRHGEPRRTRAAEAVGYVGAALAVGALGVLFEDVWQQLATGGRLALVALQCAAYGRYGTAVLGFGLLIAVAAVIAAVAVGGTHHLAVGAFGLFVLLPQLVIDVFGDTIGAPATVLVVGLLLVLLVIGLGRARRGVDAVDGEPRTVGGTA